MASKVTIVYYSATSTTYELAQAIEQGAREAGAEVRLRKVRELAPAEAIGANKAWAEHLEATKDVPEATHADLLWADAIILGAPTRFGMPAAQLKQFIDTTGPLWAKGQLADKIVSSFTSAATPHGGHESTLIALNNTFYHWGSIIVPPGYNDAVQNEAGTPYGTSFVSQNGALSPDDVALRAARFQGRRVAEVAARFSQPVDAAA